MPFRTDFIVGALLSAGSFAALFDAGTTSPAETSSSPPLTIVPAESAGRSLATVGPESSSNEHSFDESRSRLATAVANAEKLQSYTTVLEIEEEVNDRLRPAALVDVKIRREPFSVYMRWQDGCQEALYVDGQNDNCVVVKPKSGLAVFKKVWRLDPNSRLAKQACRYPITDSGLARLALRVQDFYSSRTDWPTCSTSTSSRSSIDGKPVTVFDVIFENETVSPLYSRCRYCFEPSSGLLIALENFGWNDNDSEPRLIERYVYRSINTEARITDADFDTENPTYAFASR